jgi:hypothetical protein
MMTVLPDIPDLLTRTKALAAVDLILCPEWEYRYYSFNAAWTPGEMMASMRNGCGDEWWLVFHSDGWGALKGLAHESPAWAEGGEALSHALATVLPGTLSAFSTEPAFRWDETGFAYFCLPTDGRWTRANDLTSFSDRDAGEDDLLRHLVSPAEKYCEFARDYYETDVPVEIVRQVFSLIPISQELVSALNPDVSLGDIEEELYSEIGYPQ